MNFPNNSLVKFNHGNFLLLCAARDSRANNDALASGIALYACAVPSFRFTQALSFTQFRGILHSQATGFRADPSEILSRCTTNSFAATYLRFVIRRKRADPGGSPRAAIPRDVTCAAGRSNIRYCNRSPEQSDNLDLFRPRNALRQETQKEMQSSCYPKALAREHRLNGAPLA